ncbi:Uu.00g055330.m01.CDS01 [Anthostomella pinea]|uniref:Uu.00g055330.m01.CDS01 n=1 Tax=Anthostomella pinea TaxID=933095 RepID=A0AAI8VWU9_9PEZI|nr:Uu.00g055330.m01.CDS01 [Anthostomella pinea]
MDVGLGASFFQTKAGDELKPSLPHGEDTETQDVESAKTDDQQAEPCVFDKKDIAILTEYPLQEHYTRSLSAVSEPEALFQPSPESSRQEACQLAPLRQSDHFQRLWFDLSRLPQKRSPRQRFQRIWYTHGMLWTVARYELSLLASGVEEDCQDKRFALIDAEKRWAEACSFDGEERQ